MRMVFGKPGRPGGDAGDIHMEAVYALSTLLTGAVSEWEGVVDTGVPWVNARR